MRPGQVLANGDMLGYFRSVRFLCLTCARSACSITVTLRVVRRLLIVTVLVACAAAQVVVISSSAGASDERALLRAPGTRLDAGFRVADGTRLVGVVFPKIGSGNSTSTGWKAVLVVKSDALGAMNAYTAQAQQLGYQQVSNPAPHCWSPTRGEVFCTGFYVRGSGFLQIAVHVCQSCGPSDNPTWSASEAQLDYTMQSEGTSNGELEPITPPVGIASGGPPPSTTPTVQLTDRQYRQMLTHPGRGAALQGFDLRGDLLVAPATSFGNCQTDLVGVVTGTNLDQVVSGTPTKVGESRVTSASNGTTTWTLVERSDLPQPVLLSDSCGD